MSVTSKVKSGILLLAIFPILAMIAAWQQQNFPGGGGGATSGVFNIGTVCSGQSNCLQWVDDDSTDNCGTATTAFFTAVNAYAGPGRVQVFIGGSGAGKAYKLATASCNIPITNATNGAVLHLNATIDCAQPSGDNCIQFGPTGQSSEQGGENYFMDGNGTLYGGASLTTAGIHLEPGINVFDIGPVHFWGPAGSTHNNGFGANSATLGSCTNYSIYVDSPIAAGTIHDSYVEVSTTSATSGGCAFGNPTGGVTGTNTVVFENNLIGGGGNVPPSAICGSIGIIDGGSYGHMAGNNIYGFGTPVRVQGVGHKVFGGNIDSANCVSSSVNAAIQFGATGSATTVGPVVVEGVSIQGQSGHTTYLWAQAGDSTAKVVDVTLANNMNVEGSAGGSNNTAPIMPVAAGSACIVNTATQLPCVASGNRGFVQNYISLTNWVSSPDQLPPYFSAALSANLGPTTVFTVPTSNFNSFIEVTCLSEITTIGTTSILPTCSVQYTDANTSAAQTRTLTATSAANALGSYPSATISIYPKANTTIKICSGNTGCDAGGTNYASTGTAMVYNILVTMRMAF